MDLIRTLAHPGVATADSLGMAYTMRDGSTVEDRRLDRLVHFDEKSRNYPVMALLSTEQQKRLRSYTWRLPPELYMNQGREGQCVSYAFGHELMARPKDCRGVTQPLLREWYYRMQFIDVWPGGEYPGASPRYGGTSVLAGAKVHQELGHIKEYRWAFGEEELALGVGYKGPAVIGVNWYEGMFEPNRHGYLEPTGRLMGGHAIEIDRINIREDFYEFPNSWGLGWGMNGRAKISREHMRRLLGEDGEAVIPVLRSKELNTSPVVYR